MFHWFSRIFYRMEKIIVFVCIRTSGIVFCPTSESLLSSEVSGVLINDVIYLFIQKLFQSLKAVAILVYSIRRATPNCLWVALLLTAPVLSILLSLIESIGKKIFVVVVQVMKQRSSTAVTEHFLFRKIASFSSSYILQYTSSM